jgi:membrane-associated phospholipid phosphatase
MTMFDDTATPSRTRFQNFELDVVRVCARLAHTGIGRLLAIWVSKFGNGWLYPLLAIGLLATVGDSAWPVVMAFGVSIAIGQLLIAAWKKWQQRARPYEANPDLECLLPVQEPNSFPSGHMMTLTAAMVPTVMALPAVIWLAVPLWGLMAWSRMACAHHYPSDILVGTALGFVVGVPIAAALAGAPLL